MPRSAETRLRFIDSHVHLSDYADPSQELRFAREANALLFAAGIGQASSLRCLSLAEAIPDLVRPFVGVHPSEAEKEGDLTWFVEALARAVGVGEIGLDPKYSAVGEGSAQLRVFRTQLSAAEKTGKPVQVHTRNVEGAALAELETFSLQKVLLHWFQGEDAMARAGDKGYYVSFGPALLISRKLQRMAGAWDREHILVESDGPVAFAGLGGVGGPWLVPSVVYKLGEVLGARFVDVGELVVGNSLRFLGAGDAGASKA